MNPLQYLLEKYRNLVPPDLYVKEAVIDIIFKQTGIHFDKKDLSLRGGILYLKTSSIAKGEVMLHKLEIMRLLSERLDCRAPRDLR